ncbi:PGF-pre-PGF domain-containing protein [Candidatus Woesearchaeota archaeon]|nr:PGF-pre-PGF domain-containing protein [Candidatus Woesearchaeota archaeon]
MKMRGFWVFSVICLVFLGSDLVSAANETVNTTTTINSTFEGGSVPRIAAHKVMKTLHFSEPVKSMEFRLSEHVWAGRPIPERVTTFPLGMADLDSSKNVYSYFRIKADEKINSSVLDFLRVKLSIDAKWIEDRGLLIDGIDVYFYELNGWTNTDINVDYFGKNSDEFYYLAELPDMGYYAIVEKEEKIELNLETIEEEIIEVNISEMGNELELAEEEFNWWKILVIILVIGYFIRKRAIRKI